MRVTRSFGSYNGRRYSKPWIALVTAWPVGKLPELKFGGYLGDESGGECEIEAAAGSVVRWGQKDHRGGHTEAKWGIVQPDGGVEECTMTEARAAFSKATEVTP